MQYNKTYEISYEDRNGKLSTRKIQVKNINYYGDETILHSFCFKRKAPRDFIVSRISELINCDSGEVIENISDYFDKLMESNQSD